MPLAHHRLALVASLATLLVISSAARAQSARLGDDTPEPPRQLVLRPMPSDAEDAANVPARASAPQDVLPRVGHVESAFGMPHRSLFIGLDGQATFASTGGPQGEGGMRFGGSLVPRLTLHGLVGRDRDGRLAPTAAAHVRIAGDGDRGFAMGAVAQYKTEGFSEMGGEAEVGITVGYRKSGFGLDANLLGGFGVEEEEVGESDAEVAARAAYDAASFLRVGLEGHGRRRTSGARALRNGKPWDAKLGPQLLVGVASNLAMAISGGITNRDVAHGIAPYAGILIAGVTQ